MDETTERASTQTATREAHRRVQTTADAIAVAFVTLLVDLPPQEIERLLVRTQAILRETVPHGEAAALLRRYSELFEELRAQEP